VAVSQNENIHNEKVEVLPKILSKIEEAKIVNNVTQNNAVRLKFKLPIVGDKMFSNVDI
jgi:hypothetical protein